MDGGTIAWRLGWYEGRVEEEFWRDAAFRLAT